ncbi:nucleoside hydrolase [Arenibacter sp. BSSL-BM3]|uniref:Nucleoside hydrolase n=1 Tax=Arenibacter arenosicollis TaxID=2762274 RepID=A0ABR7QM31_9FLAO|nr:nucleoside hydrolase [Arenibacter arenosicollis]MBC8768248.1 nucleoside hydrolase [Arenibacter arenosicollis]
MQQQNNKLRTFKTLNFLKAIHFPLLQFIIPIFLFVHVTVEAQVKDTRLPLIIDADTANEVDDLYAIVRAVAEPKFNILGITSAQFHTSPLATDSSVYESQRINERILKLMGQNTIPLPLGSNVPIKNSEEPASSPASHFIVDMAHELPDGQKLNVVVLGPCTNIASAILEDPSIIPKLKVHYLGFWHNVETNIYNKKEFNSGNDPKAVEILLNTEGLDITIMTATTSQHLVFTKAEVDDNLKTRGGVSDYLINRWETYERWWTKEDPEKSSWIMWDVAIIEALARPELSKTETFLTPKENTQRLINIHTEIDVEIMKTDFWQSLKKI